MTENNKKNIGAGKPAGVAPEDLKKQILENQAKRKEDQKGKPEDKKNDSKPEAVKEVPLYMKAIDAVDAAIKEGKLPGVQKKEVSIYVGYYKDGVKIGAINKSKKFQTFFRSEAPGVKFAKVEGVKSVTKEEAKKNHYGSIRSMYVGSDANMVVRMLQASLG